MACCDHFHGKDSKGVLVLGEESTVADRRRFVQALAAGGAMFVAGAASGCTTNPITGEQQLTGLLPSGQIDQMAAASWAETKQELPEVRDPRYRRRLQSVGGRIKRVAPGAGDNWEYAVFDQEVQNAFVLPGGRVGFYKGMMDFSENESQIGAVMGHEVGHVVGRHAQERANQQLAGQLGTAVGAVAVGRGENAQRNMQLIQALGLGYQLGVVLPYSRNHERQADLLGVNYLHRAGYDKGQAIRLWERMAAEAGPSRQPEFMSTHPDPASRAQYIANYIQEQDALGSQGYQDTAIKDFNFDV